MKPHGQRWSLGLGCLLEIARSRRKACRVRFLSKDGKVRSAGWNRRPGENCPWSHGWQHAMGEFPSSTSSGGPRRGEQRTLIVPHMKGEGAELTFVPVLEVDDPSVKISRYPGDDPCRDCRQNADSGNPLASRGYRGSGCGCCNPGYVRDIGMVGIVSGSLVRSDRRVFYFTARFVGRLDRSRAGASLSGSASSFGFSSIRGCCCDVDCRSPLESAQEAGRLRFRSDEIRGPLMSSVQVHAAMPGSPSWDHSEEWPRTAQPPRTATPFLHTAQGWHDAGVPPLGKVGLDQLPPRGCLGLVSPRDAVRHS